jgi:hypothetical protein
MKSEVKVEFLQKLMPSSRSILYFQIIGTLIFMVALLFSNENIIYIFLLLMGEVALTKGFDKSIFQNKFKQIME